MGDVDAAQDDASGLGLDHAAGHAEAGGFSSAVGAEQADDFAAADAKIDAVDDAPASVRLNQPLDFKDEFQARSSLTLVGLIWHGDRFRRTTRRKRRAEDRLRRKAR